MTVEEKTTVSNYTLDFPPEVHSLSTAGVLIRVYDSLISEHGLSGNRYNLYRYPRAPVLP